MLTVIYKQTDERWRWLPYPGHGYFINGAGCGCLSVLHCIIENPEYRSYKVPNVIGFMRQYATYGDGTKRAGITAGLEHWGMNNVIRWGDLPMKKVWPELNKGGRVGVILFGGRKGPDGTVWTTGGHYIAFTDYKVEGGKHKFYLKDSAWRNHSGWYSYERSMKGDILDIWTCTPPKSKKKGKTYAGEFPKITVKTKKLKGNGQVLATTAKGLCWELGTKKKKWQYKTGEPTKAYKKATEGKANITRSDCGYFVMVALREAGIIKSCDVLDWGAKLPGCLKKVHDGGKIKTSDLEPGDIIRYKKTDGQHTLIWMGGGVVAEAGRGVRYPVLRKTNKFNAGNVRKSTLEVLRPVKETTVTREYLKKGDKGDEVLKWQKFLHWYFSEKVTSEDGVFGDATQKYTEKMQDAEGLIVDGTVGKDTLKAAKAVKR